MKCIIVRYSEIGLKGKNKSDFEKKLASNIEKYLTKNNIKYNKVVRTFSRIVVYTEAEARLDNIYGISSFSYAQEISNDVDTIKKTVTELIQDFDSNTVFRVSVQRLNKRYPIKSMDLEREIGAFIVECKNSKVNLKHFEREVAIEIFDDFSYVFSNKIKGPGGIPVGVEGKVITIIDDDDSIKAAKLIMKRGCDIIPVSYKNTDISELINISPNSIKLHIIKDINDVNQIANEQKALALVVGQKLNNFKEFDINMLTLRPLIAED